MNYSKEATEIFLEKYKSLEAYREKPNVYQYLEKKYDRKIDLFRYIRNFLSHNTTKDYEYPVIVSQSILEDLEQILKEIELKAEQKMIPFEKLYTAKMNSSLNDILDVMYTNNYSYIPILDNRQTVIGVFTDNCILSYIAKNNVDLIYNNKTAISKFKEFTSLSNNQNEEFLFFDKDEYFYIIKEHFSVINDNNKRTSAVFITDNGKFDGKILGMITVWDVL